MGRVTTRHRVVRLDGRHPEGTTAVDTLAVEEPLEIRISGRSFTTTMRTPGHDVELALGLLSSEGVIARHEDLLTARHCAGSAAGATSGTMVDSATGDPVTSPNTYNVLDLRLAPGIRPPEERARTQVTTSACGVCGTRSIELLRQELRHDIHADSTAVSAEAVLAMPAVLRDAQRTFETTGGLHAAALFSADGELLVAREDVGRHNATDKVIGWAIQQGMMPGRGRILFVSGRTSFELAQKAAMAGIPVLAGISAPSSLAAEVCEDAGITLIGFVRGERMNVYTHPERMLAGAASAL